MAPSLLNSTPNPFLKTNPAITGTHTATGTSTIAAAATRRCLPVRCGPRDGRGPLVKGRTLSIEAIQAVQSLKRAQRSNADDLASFTDRTLSRLIKSDLVAALRELLRQGECTLALRVLAAIRSEYPGGAEYLSLYADVAHALARAGETGVIDELVSELERDSCFAVGSGDRKGLKRLLTAVIGAELRDSVVKIYNMMRRSGLGSGATVDDHSMKVLTRGLRRFGEVGLAEEIEGELGRVYGRQTEERMGIHTL